MENLWEDQTIKDSLEVHIFTAKKPHGSQLVIHEVQNWGYILNPKQLQMYREWTSKILKTRLK